VQKLGRTAAQVGATILEATIDGAAVQARPERVACTYTGRDPATIEVRTLSGFLDTENLVTADLVDGELQLFGNDFFGTTIASEDLSVQISDSLREIDISWDTDESTGSMFVDCGSTLFDMSELVELLRKS
ncbi:MAG: hypothetical protein GXP35_07750, partial [Actinobacteria bacterium]|nr:hypothetical protein [Actinomycetota bacterium]